MTRERSSSYGYHKQMLRAFGVFHVFFVYGGGGGGWLRNYLSAKTCKRAQHRGHHLDLLLQIDSNIPVYTDINWVDIPSIGLLLQAC